MKEAVVALAKGEAVHRDIGDSDPERMAAPMIADYLKAKEKDWNAAGITMEIVPVNETRHPLAYAVGRATETYEPHKGRVVYLTYTPEGPVDQTILLVGKGITIDTGGADLKVDGVMYGMHSDKMGGAMVAGFFETLSHLKPKGLKVFGYMAFVRNSIGKNAYLPDEILITRNGKRVRIGNTDAEGRLDMADILDEARLQAMKSINPHIFTIATLTGAATRSFGTLTVSMDNGPARLVKMAESLSDAGDMIADPSEVARIRYEDFQVNYPLSDWEDVMQFNDKPGATSNRGFTFPMGFMCIASDLDKHGCASDHPIPYTHSDIAGSAGGIGTLATGSPLRMVIAMKLRKILLVVGPMLTALPHYNWAMKHNPKLTAALGALHSLYVPIQVREMTSTKQKFNRLGLFQFGDKLANSTLAVSQGVAVYRDIGNGDPIRMAAPRIAEYLEERRAAWEAAGINMKIVEPNERDHPMAWAVNRAVKGPIDQTLLIVGKGVTIDTGGADLKINGGMYGMHNDKMGAASVAGFFEILSHLQPKGLKVFGYMPYIRNGLDKHAYLPDEIIVARNGMRVRIGNTDAEGRVILSDVLDEARQQALKEVNPHIFTIATLTGAAVKAYGKVARVRYEDYQVNYGISEYEDIMQFNTLPGSTSKRGFTFPMGYLALISGLSNHGLSSQSPLPYTHTDIAPSSGGIGTYGTGSPLRMYANRFILPRVLP
ncbi:unnamed protein product [Schistocephalus solidus]|uniref:Cytosol aminopeptidase domain-containing protein n=1 Tax=Schistocephalus solidus TaxID=70667 RepID=A0A3P7D7W9_SCHSO|nr:unnamed protein product [Schistocephalus solidus]